MADRGQPGELERRQLRPYRRFVRWIFALVIVALCILLLRGIVRHLDRMPAVDTLYAPDTVDVRALRACAEDLAKLEKKIRKGAGTLFAREPGNDPIILNDWLAFSNTSEIERRRIAARCHLEHGTNDRAVEELAAASEAIEDLIRSYSLLYDRHREGGLPQAKTAQEAIKRALVSLKAR